MTTRENTAKNIDSKEKLQQLAHKFAGDIFCCQLRRLLQKNVRKIGPKIRTLENGAESSNFCQKAKVLETHLVKINKTNVQMKAAL